MPSGETLADEPAGRLLVGHEAPFPSVIRGRRLSSPQVLRHVGSGEVRHLGRVAGDHVERLPVRRQDHGMRPVLAAAFELPEHLDLIERVVGVGIGDPVKPAGELAPVVDDDIEAIERPEQALGLADGDVDRLDLDVRRRDPELGRGDAVQLAILIRGDQPPFRVDRQVHPRALRFARDRVDQLDLEAFGTFQLVAGQGGRSGSARAGGLLAGGLLGGSRPDQETKTEQHGKTRHARVRREHRAHLKIGGRIGPCQGEPTGGGMNPSYRHLRLKSTGRCPEIFRATPRLSASLSTSGRDTRRSPASPPTGRSPPSSGR